MKLSFILCLLALSSAICYAQEASGLDLCIADLKSDVAQVKEMAKSLSSLNFIKFRKQLTVMGTQIDTTVAHCKTIQKMDIMKFAFEHASEQQRDCLVNVMGTVFSLNVCKDDLKEHNFKQFMSDLNNVISNLKETKKVCL